MSDLAYAVLQEDAYVIIGSEDDIGIVTIDAETSVVTVGEQGPAGPGGGGGGAASSIGGAPIETAVLIAGDHLEFSGSAWINVSKITLSDGGNF